MRLTLERVLAFGSFFAPHTPVISDGHETCPPLLAEDLTLRQYQLYPENLMWDKKRCVAYVRYASCYNERAEPLCTAALLTLAATSLMPL